jgi:hypothetical protein
VIPVGAVVASVAAASQGLAHKWMPAIFGFVGLVQWVGFLAWQWAVATRFGEWIGDRPGLRLSAFRATFWGMIAAFAVFLSGALAAPEYGTAILFVAMVGNCCYAYALAVVASILTRADLGPEARTRDVVLLAIGLFALSAVWACVVQRRVNRAYERCLRSTGAAQQRDETDEAHGGW